VPLGKSGKAAGFVLKKVEPEKRGKSLAIERAEKTLLAVSRQAGNFVQEFPGGEAKTRDTWKQGNLRKTRELAGERYDYDETIPSDRGVYKGNHEADICRAGVDRR